MGFSNLDYLDLSKKIATERNETKNKIQFKSSKKKGKGCSIYLIFKKQNIASSFHGTVGFGHFDNVYWYEADTNRQNDQSQQLCGILNTACVLCLTLE